MKTRFLTYSLLLATLIWSCDDSQSTCDPACKTNEHCDKGQCVCDNGYQKQGNACVQVTTATLFVGPTRQYKDPKDVEKIAKAGDIIEIDAGTYKSFATWTQNDLTIRGNGKVVLDLKGVSIGNKKAAWVISGSNVTVEGITFTGAAVPDKNGAGIRYEGNGRLNIKNCLFYSNEMGILTTNKGTEEIYITESEFYDHGRSAGGQSHNIYIGQAAHFEMTYTYSHDAVTGHNVKSRARVNRIMYNMIIDHNETPVPSSYLIDLPEGGDSIVMGNVFRESPKSSNRALLSFAKENQKAPIQSFVFVNNTVINDRSSATLVNLGGKPVILIKNNIINNITEKDYISDTYTGEVQNNISTTKLADITQFDYRLKADSEAINKGLALKENHTPKGEYDLKQKRGTRKSDAMIDIGAYEF